MQNPGLWNPEYWSRTDPESHLRLESILQVPLTENMKSVGEWHPESGIHNPRLSWIPLHGEIQILESLHPFK